MKKKLGIVFCFLFGFGGICYCGCMRVRRLDGFAGWGFRYPFSWMCRALPVAGSRWSF